LGHRATKSRASAIHLPGNYIKWKRGFKEMAGHNSILENGHCAGVSRQFPHKATAVSFYADRGSRESGHSGMKEKSFGNLNRFSGASQYS
ncbi:MAG TPA: hypothetical protein VIG90_10375, partial [Pedomonas sp.]|uniref:hypothetical protein n=1 Tax=Pedomonas sp. TaxID=2976421 RepID=UPI002F40E27F